MNEFKTRAELLDYKLPRNSLNPHVMEGDLCVP